MAKVRVCKKCGTELIVISEPKVVKTDEVTTPGWSLVEGQEIEALDGFKYSPAESVGGTQYKTEWLGQFQCPKCDPGGESFIDATQMEFKDIESATIEDEIELSNKAKEEVEKNEPTVIWEEEKIPGKGWND